MRTRIRLNLNHAHSVHHAFVPLFVKRFADEDPAISRARDKWQLWQRELFILETLSVLREQTEVAA